MYVNVAMGLCVDQCATIKFDRDRVGGKWGSFWRFISFLYALFLVALAFSNCRLEFKIAVSSNLSTVLLHMLQPLERQGIGESISNTFGVAKLTMFSSKSEQLLGFESKLTI